MAKLELLHTIAGIIKEILESRQTFHKKKKMLELSTISILGMHAEEMKTVSLGGIFILMFEAALFSIAKNLK